MASDFSTPVRYSTRVLLLDSSDRLLLLHHELEDGQSLWLPPGGGLEGDESPEQAAIREVAEETGILLGRLSHCIWTRHPPGSLQFEYFFVTRVDDDLPVVTGLNADAIELASLRGYRWWAHGDIRAASGETFVPRRLGELLAPVLRGELPANPFEVGW